MLFHGIRKKLSENTLCLKINNTNIQRVTEFNFLGVVLDEHLSWKPHINKISKNISRSIGVINNLKHIFPTYLLKTLYYSLIHSHMLTGILMWGSKPSNIYQLQKKAVRLITKRRYISHTSPIFKTLEVLKLEDLYKLHVLKFYFNLKTYSLPNYFNNFDVITRSEIHSYNTRGSKSLQTVKTNLKSTENCLRVALPKLVNATDPSILSKVYTHSLAGFSLYIKKFYLNQYTTSCTINDCYVCALN